MRKQTKVLLIASALVASLAAAPALLAEYSRGHGMMGLNGMMDRGGAMSRGENSGRDDMMRGGMMGMMGSMSRMMDHCATTMGDGDRNRPNDQWRRRQ